MKAFEPLRAPTSAADPEIELRTQPPLLSVPAIDGGTKLGVLRDESAPALHPSGGLES
jgi:hypothetical protein